LDNKLVQYIDDGGRATDKPLSYSTVEKTFFSFFINGEPLSTNISFGLEDGMNPREIERNQIVSVMNVIAEEILIDKFDFTIGTNRIENRIRAGEVLPPDHIRACRMCKEEIMYSWLNLIWQIVRYYFVMTGTPIDEKCLFEREFDQALVVNIKNAVKNISNLPLWKNMELSIFGGKQVSNYWKTVFETGRTPEGMLILAEPIRIPDLVKA